MFPDELVIIGVHSAKFPSEQLTENIHQAVMRLGILHPVVNDAGFRIWNAYAARAWPTLVLINPNGRIVYTTAGEVEAADLAKVIRKVLQETPATARAGPRLEQTAAPATGLLNYPAKLLAAGDLLYVADSGHHRILQLRLDPDRRRAAIERIFGSGQPGLQDGPAGQAAFNHPHGLALHSGGPAGSTLYVADTGNNVLRAIRLESGQVETIAGTGRKGRGGVSLQAPTAMDLRSPWALVSFEHYLLIAMAGSHQIWVLVDEQQLGPFAGSGYEALVDGPVAKAGFNQPSGLALGVGYLFVADPEASAIRAISLNEEPAVITLVGQGLFEFGDRDGVGDQVRLQHPGDVAYDNGVVTIADTYNNKIKTLNPETGEVATLIGSGQAALQDGPFEQAALWEPEGVQAVDEWLYIADTNNHAVRVANLDRNELWTLEIEPPAEEGAPAGPERMERTAAPGEVTLVLQPRLPAGMARNPDAPSTILVRHAAGQQLYTFGANQELLFTLPTGVEEADVELTLYYCDAETHRLCFVADRQLAVTLPRQEGEPSRLELPLEIQS